MNALEAIAQLDAKAAKKAIAARVDGMVVDLDAPVSPEQRVEAVVPGGPGSLDLLRHSTAHIMAEAVRTLFPGVKVAIGPAITDGFYYDFEYTRPFTPEDLPAIEEKMRELIKANQSFEHHLEPKDQILDEFKEQGETYKVELIEALEDDQVSIYKQGGFTDLCRGPHLPSTGKVGAFKLLSVAGAYWRGDENNTMLSRIYGTAFFDKKALKQHLKFLEEAKKRDHRKLGRELDLFSFHEELGAGMVVWHPKGMLLRYLIEEFERFRGG